MEDSKISRRDFAAPGEIKLRARCIESDCESIRWVSGMLRIAVVGDIDHNEASHFMAHGTAPVEAGARTSELSAVGVLAKSLSSEVNANSAGSVVASNRKSAATDNAGACIVCHFSNVVVKMSLGSARTVSDASADRSVNDDS